MARVNKLIPSLVFLSVLIVVIYAVEPPTTIYNARWQQLIFFFGPLFLLLVSLYNLYFKFIWHSLLFALSTILLVILYLLGALNLITGVLTLAATLLIYKSVVRHQQHRAGLPVRIPKLSRLEKQ